MEKVIISNKKSFAKKKTKLVTDGFDNLHVIADFDRTITKAFVNQNFCPALISIFATEHYLSTKFNEKEKELFNYYHPIELDSSISITYKKEKMEEWWDKMAENMIHFSLNKNLFVKAAKSDKIELRDKTKKVFEFFNSKNVPLIIISANGLGDESIREVLRYKGILYENLEIVSNKFIWNENGYAIDYIKPHIHAFNKDETSINSKVKEKIENRDNVILLGDSIGDCNMAQNSGIILKIGFLNYQIDEKIEEYKKHYDVVITNDGSMNFLYELLYEF